MAAFSHVTWRHVKLLYNLIIAKYQQPIGCHFEGSLLKKHEKKKIRPLEGQKYFTSSLFKFRSNFLPPTIFFNFSGCQEGSSVQDQCGQRCTCTGGQLVNCVRIRKEFTDMTLEERRLYIKTIKTASTDPRFKTDYDNLLNSHRILFLSGLCTPLMPLVTV